MKLSVYLPKKLELPLKVLAEQAGLSPALYVQALVRDRLQGADSEWSDEFRSVAGSWEDLRSTEEIIRDIEDHRTSTDLGEWSNRS